MKRTAADGRFSTACMTSNRLFKKYFYTGCSKMHRCKARDIVRNEAYFLYAAVTNNERNAADGRFSTAC